MPRRGNPGASRGRHNDEQAGQSSDAVTINNEPARSFSARSEQNGTERIVVVEE